MTPKYTDKERYPHGYVKSGATDIRKTFARIRKQQAEEQRQRMAVEAEQVNKVRRIKP